MKIPFRLWQKYDTVVLKIRELQTKEFSVQQKSEREMNRNRITDLVKWRDELREIMETTKDITMKPIKI